MLDYYNNMVIVKTECFLYYFGDIILLKFQFKYTRKLDKKI